jgi:stage III sporulation protein AF
MGQIGAWVIQLLVVAIVYTILEIILPSGNLKNFARVSIGLMIMLAILSPLSSMILGGNGMQDIFDREGDAIEQMTNVNNEDMKKSYEEWVWKVYVEGENNNYESEKGNDK